MDSYNDLSQIEIKPNGEISKKILELGIKWFHKACEYIHNIEYGNPFGFYYHTR